MNVQSTVTPNVTVALKTRLNGSARKAKAKATVSPNAITREQAITAAFEYGASMAGFDGTLVKAIQAFKADDSVLAEMLEALNVGYVTRKLGVDKEEATRIVGLLKYNENKEDDEHRTFEQERVMISVRVLWSRAKKMAGVAKAEAQVKAEATRAAKEAEREEHQARLIRADEIVNPKDDVDVFDSLSRLVLTMKSIRDKYAGKLTGDRGSAWREWLAKAPK
jgi:hypothetical protein